MLLTQRQHWISWILLVMFFFTHYFIRVSPPILSIELMKHYSVSISHLGLLSSLYFLTYTAAQIPVGYLMKIYPQKNLVVIASFGCALMSLGFSLAPTFPWALCSLMCYAFFGAFGFIGAISYAAQHLPAHASFLIGITRSMGMASGFIATNWLGLQLTHQEWPVIVQKISLSLGILGSLLFILMPVSQVSAPMAMQTDEPECDLSDNEPSIYYNTQTWINALYAGCIYFPMMVFTEGGLGPSMLRSIHQQSQEAILFPISMIFIASMIGGPLCGLIVNTYGRTKIMRLSAIAGLFTVSTIMFIPMSIVPLTLCLCLFGFTNTGLIGCLSLATDMHGPKQATLSLALVNMFTILIGSIFNGILPHVLENTANATFIAGIPYYQSYDYQKVFGTVLILAPIMAYLCASFVKEPVKTAIQTT